MFEGKSYRCSIYDFFRNSFERFKKNFARNNVDTQTLEAEDPDDIEPPQIKVPKQPPELKKVVNLDINGQPEAVQDAINFGGKTKKVKRKMRRNKTNKFNKK